MYNDHGFYSSSNRAERLPSSDMSWGNHNVNLPVPGGVVRKNTEGNGTQTQQHAARPVPTLHQNLYRDHFSNPYPPAPPPHDNANGNKNFEGKNRSQTVPAGAQAAVPPQSSAQNQDWNQWAPTGIDHQMLSLGGNVARSFISSNVAKYHPGVGVFWLSLKYYFTVDHAYIAKKLKLLLFPFAKKKWERISHGGVSMGHGVDSAAQFAKPVYDENAPDLYLPLMSFITYALILGFVKGQASNFTPDVLIEILSSALVAQLLELCVIRLGAYLLSAPAKLLDIVSFCGYKFVALCINLFVGVLLGRQLYYAATVYTALASACFMYKTMSGVVPHGQQSRRAMLLGFSALQCLSIFWLGDSKDLY